MRKLSIVALAVAGLLLAAGPAGAVITGTAHQLSAGCGACHIPHGAAGARLWVAAAVTGTEVVGTVSPLCAYCHISGGGAGLANAQPYTSTRPTVYGSASHGVVMTLPSTYPTSTTVTSSGLPYVAPTATAFECTTCHDVHADGTTGGGGQRPFLRDTVNAICARCHTNRHYVGGTLSQGGTVTPGAWGSAQAGTGNPGSHPIGSDVTGDVFGTSGNSPIGIPVVMAVTTNTTANGWSLGGHLYSGASTGGVTCVTCHTVHGIEFDAQDPNTSNLGGAHANDSSPNSNFLAMAQVGGTLGGRTVANGSGGTNPLCEGCHGSTNVGGAIYMAGGTYKVNPGNTGRYTHPVDDYDAAFNAGITAFPSTWPTGLSSLATTMNPVAICESCHQPHPAAEIAASRSDVMAGAGDYILRAPMNTICQQCHLATTSIAGHHPTGMSFSASGVTYLAGPASAGGTQTLTCSTCHGGAAGGAHNWTLAHSPGVSAGWKPADNGRSATQATDMFNVDMSKTCMDCHFFMTGSALANPTMGTATTMIAAGETEYQKTGGASHYVGAIHNSATNWKGDGTAPYIAPVVNIYSTTQTWSAQQGSMGFANGWSRFGGSASGAAVLVCESCHSIRPARNNNALTNGDHLLLGTYLEGQNGLNDGVNADGLDQFCLACHGIPNGTHQMTGMTVTRTGAVLSAASAKAWLRGDPPAAEGDATFSGANMSCDGCHQTHSANTNSSTFILDAPASITLGSFTGAPVATGTADSANPSTATNYSLFDGTTPTGSAGTYASPTLEGRGGAVTGFCDQCHTYAY